MPGGRPLVVQSEELSEHALLWLRERCDVVHCRPTQQPEFEEWIRRAEGLVVRTYTRVDAACLASAPMLRVVGRAGVGLDNIDVPACRARGVEVVHTPDANGDAVAEFVFVMLLDALRPRWYVDQPHTPERWSALRQGLIAPRQLGELTLGILGMGKIGRRVARIARAFSMRVLYHDLAEIPAIQREGAEPAAIDRLLGDSDVVSLHVDARAANRHLVNDAFLAKMRDSAVLVNTSRGLVVNAAALARWLRERPDAVALLDVHDPEPFDGTYALLGLPNARLTPHLAAATRTAHENMSWVVRDVWRVLTGEKPHFPAP